jgi:two-component system sensor histidine kinase QseC
LLARVQSSLDGERRFTADAAHELRTPLAAVRAQVQVAQGATDAAGRDHALAGALAAGERATRILEQLLTLARLEHNAWREAATDFDPHRVAAEAIAERAAQAHARHIELALEGEAGTTAAGHAGLAAIALGNLVDNAIRYSPPDTAVTVRVAREGGRAVARVRDDGPGIPVGKRGEVLRRFTRLEGSAEGGSGLGLSIVARIADLHGEPLALGDGPAGRGLEATLRFPAG